MAATTMTMIGPGWELWQPWLIAAIGSGWIALILLRYQFEESRNIWTLRD
jgi:protein-S-isoprenylcysteine O-methyltransferase Ste14